MKIVLDPGDGGRDPEAVGPTGLTEVERSSNPLNLPRQMTDRWRIDDEWFQSYSY